MWAGYQEVTDITMKREDINTPGDKRGSEVLALRFSSPLSGDDSVSSHSDVRQLLGHLGPVNHVRVDVCG